MASTVPVPWKTNVLGILGDCRVLFASILCPALAYYATSEQFEEPPAGVVESCIGGYCLCCGWMLRRRLRMKYGLDGSTLGDFLAHLCCHCVALARIWREAEIQTEAKNEQGTQLAPNFVPPQSFPVSPPVHPYVVPPPGQQVIIQTGLQPGTQAMTYLTSYGGQPMFMGHNQMMMPPITVSHPQPMHDVGNTVDTNLSEFDSKNEPMVGREETSSYKRADSMDPPPSNTDPDPWDMIPSREEMRKKQLSRRPNPPGHDTTPLPSTRPPEMRPHPTVGMTYEEYISGEVVDTVAVEKRPTTEAPVQRVESDESSESRRAQLNQRLAGLRPSNMKNTCSFRHGRNESEGSTSRVAQDTCDLADQADQVILASTNLVRILSIPREEHEDYRQWTSQEDPPQPQLDGMGSLISKPDGAPIIISNNSEKRDCFPRCYTVDP